MKSFEEISNKITLIRYIGSEFGTMYFEPNVPKEEETIIRHLDNKLTTELLPTYVDMYDAIITWIEGKTNIQEYVFLPPLLEVGKDYFIRPFYAYDIAIRDYMNKEDEDYVEPPELFEEMRNIVAQELNNEVSGKESIIQKVVKKSLLEPSGKTIYDNRRMNKFIIVEPKISLNDLNEWEKASNFLADRSIQISKIEWDQIKSTLDKLQIASLHETGKKELIDIIHKLDEGGVYVKKGNSTTNISNRQELQEMINTYDSTIQLSQII